jgi:hypothetical protein
MCLAIHVILTTELTARMDEAQIALLATAFRHMISEPNVEAGYDRFRSINSSALSFETFCDAVAECLHEGLIREPIRLPEGALQCHWHLELTPRGVAAARSLAIHPHLTD